MESVWDPLQKKSKMSHFQHAGKKRMKRASDKSADNNKSEDLGVLMHTNHDRLKGGGWCVIPMMVFR